MSTYLQSRQYILTEVGKAVIQSQVSVWEGVIQTMFKDKVWKETQDAWLVQTHCNELQTACLQKRVDIIGNAAIKIN